MVWRRYQRTDSTESEKNASTPEDLLLPLGFD
jgi:hypothetical protein